MGDEPWISQFMNSWELVGAIDDHRPHNILGCVNNKSLKLDTKRSGGGEKASAERSAL